MIKPNRVHDPGHQGAEVNLICHCIQGCSRFGSVRFLSKKVTKPNFFFKKNRNRTETGSNRPVSVWFGSVFQRKNRFKPVWLGFFGLARFFPIWLGFFGLARFFRFGSVWLGFFPVFFGSVRFGFSGSRLKKPKPNRTSPFFQNFNRFNRFFFSVRFFRLFFSSFLDLIGFSVFLNTPNCINIVLKNIILKFLKKLSHIFIDHQYCIQTYEIDRFKLNQFSHGLIKNLSQIRN